MKRLRDEITSDDPAVARAADIVRDAPRIPRDDERLERVAARIRAANEAGPRPRGGARTAVTISAVGVAILLLLGYALLRPRPPAAAPPAPPAVAAPPPAIPPPTPAPPRADASPLQAPPPRASDTPPQLSPSSPAPPAAPPSTARGPRKAKLAPAPIVDLEGEAALVRRATEALRRDHDPARAMDLLREYRRRHPNGALADEALYLTVEAGRATGDPDTAARAREYVARFPDGRFRRRVEQLLGELKK